jgi:hypothetical protein
MTGPLTTGDAETEIRSVLEITVPFRQYTAEMRYIGIRKKRRIIVKACADDALRVPSNLRLTIVAMAESASRLRHRPVPRSGQWPE